MKTNAWLRAHRAVDCTIGVAIVHGATQPLQLYARNCSWNKAAASWVTTPLGKATQASGLDPALVMLMRADLERAQKAFNMVSDLHLTYLITPMQQLDFRPDWHRYAAMVVAKASDAQRGAVMRLVRHCLVGPWVSIPYVFCMGRLHCCLSQRMSACEPIHYVCTGVYGIPCCTVTVCHGHEG